MTPAKDADTLVREGLAADRLLNDTTFTDVLETLVADTSAAWMRERDRDQREALWQRVQALGAITLELKIRSDRGKAARGR